MELYITNRKRKDLPFNMDLSPEDMPVSVLNNALALAEEKKEVAFVLCGNEPGLHPDLEKILGQVSKHGIRPVVETSGLLPDSAVACIVSARPMVMLRVYRPSFMTDEDRAEIQANLGKFKEAGLQVTLVLMIDDMEADYSFIKEYMQETKVGSLHIRMDCNKQTGKVQELMSRLAQLAKELTLMGADVMLNCGALACMFDDASFGMLAKLGVPKGVCIPHLLVLPDGSMAHCANMVQVPGPHVSSFKSLDALVEYYYDVFRDMQNSVPDNSPCSQCVTRRKKLCTGPAMAIKAGIYLQERKLMKEAMAEPGEPESDKHKENMWRMALASARLGMHADAVECLEELRRITPEDPNAHYMLACSYWEVDRKGEAEEEFRKCSRLSENPVPALYDLYQRLVKAGKAIRARMLLEEIKKLVAQMKAEGKTP